MKWLLASFLFISASSASAVDVCSPCDFNNDGAISVVDHAVFLGAYQKQKGQPGFDARVDYNGDGAVTVVDFGIYLKFCLNGGKE